MKFPRHASHALGGPDLAVSTFSQTLNAATREMIGFAFVERVPCAIEINTFFLDTNNDLQVTWKVASSSNDFLKMVLQSDMPDHRNVALALSQKVGDIQCDANLSIWNCASKIPLKFLEPNFLCSTITVTRHGGFFVFKVVFTKNISSNYLYQYSSSPSVADILREAGIV